MNLKKHPILEVISTVVTLASQLIALRNYEIDSLFTCNSEIP
jgi:hypothetical protein